ncbi:hypothetical protein GCM10008927_15370 [Amylibacter ulvae]|uniref:DUF1127 domain-containing protein n=1 Tax=Paramylibacter ulvae TaxID=1651968 RepID=A0ABQ3D4R0_9RHOB|nr:DUF1127 domain-containing protein [Amylibacter ulvae]GHA51026.1 hypothetical protein GCM10008927_15370 [Amylibacter ulvae]
MAQVATTTASVRDIAVSVLSSIGNWFIKVGEAHSRSSKFEEMNNLTDVELATKYGINRDQIAAYIFRDRMI